MMQYLISNNISLLLLCLLIVFTNAQAKNIKDPLQDKISVVVWDERQENQKQAYNNYLGNFIADYLREKQGISVLSVALDDPEQGISNKILNQCDVLIWWGHVRHDEITWQKSQEIVQRIKEGKLSLIALHATHWATPFVEAMNERTRMDAEPSYIRILLPQHPVVKVRFSIFGLDMNYIQCIKIKMY